MNQLVNTFKVLSDETRIRIINLLSKQDMCVCEIEEVLNLPQPKISKHMAKIRNANLVSTSRKEQFIYYSLDQDNEVIKSIVNGVLKYENTQLKDDIKVLESKAFCTCSR